GLSADQVTFAHQLYERKLARPGGIIELTGDQVKWLESTFEDPRQRYLELAQLSKGEKEEDTINLKGLDSLDPKAEFQKAMKLCREGFAAIGILFPIENGGK